MSNPSENSFFLAILAIALLLILMENFPKVGGVALVLIVITMLSKL